MVSDKILEEVLLRNQNLTSKENTFIFWFVVNLVIVFGLIKFVLIGNLFNIVDWVLNILSIHYIKEVLLFIIVFVLDIILGIFFDDYNTMKSGIIVLILYYLIDYFYLVNNIPSLSLLA